MSSFKSYFKYFIILSYKAQKLLFIRDIHFLLEKNDDLSQANLVLIKLEVQLGIVLKGNDGKKNWQVLLKMKLLGACKTFWC